MKIRNLPIALKLPVVTILLIATLIPRALGQQMQAPGNEDIAAKLAKMQQQIEATQKQLDEQRSALKALQEQLLQSGQIHAIPAPAPAPAALPESDASSLQQAVADLREEQSVLQSEIAVHEQTKLETLSRYKLRVGGLVLFNAFSNNGSVDSTDVPILAVPKTPGQSTGSLGASLRQSLITLDASGPQFWGARSYANLQLDFFGGLTTGDYTSTAGTVRMRAASLQLAWPTTNVHAGLERLLIAPSSPTSYVSIGEPALSWSGNLWAWVPQLAVEKTLPAGDRSGFLLAGAVVDVPDPGGNQDQYLRTPTAAESSRYPGVEARTGYSWHHDPTTQSAQPSTGYSNEDGSSGIFMSGYFSPHNYGSSGSVDAWAGAIDWRLALPARFSFTGEAYKGIALGGLGGGAFKDIASVSYYKQPGVELTKAVGLRNEGGWAQLKYHPADFFEINTAFGQDNDTASQLRRAKVPDSDPYTGLARNQTFLANAIFRIHTSFLLSLEYRKLRSWQLNSTLNQADIIGLAAGFEF